MVASIIVGNSHDLTDKHYRRSFPYHKVWITDCPQISYGREVRVRNNRYREFVRILPMEGGFFKAVYSPALTKFQKGEDLDHGWFLDIHTARWCLLHVLKSLEDPEYHDQVLYSRARVAKLRCAERAL